MKALKIKVEFTTGKRAGGIDPRRDGNRYPLCTNWQNLEEGWEVRLVKDEDLSKFENQKGIEILSGADEIDEAICKCSKISYSIWNDGLMVESIRQRGIDLNDWNNMDGQQDFLQSLYELNVLGIHKTEPVPTSAVEMCKRHGFDT